MMRETLYAEPRAFHMPAGTVGDGVLRLFNLGAVAPIPVYLTPFLVQTFGSARFAVENIFQPPEIARSVIKRQAEYFYGRLCARHALLALGMAGHTVASGRMREPIWPDGVIGSITHSARYAAAAVVRTHPDHGIGIDIEQVVDATTRETILATVIDRHEHALLARVAGLSLDHCLTLAFSVKESFFKASCGVVGRYFDFDAVTLLELDPVCKTIVLRVNQDLCPQFERGQRVKAVFDLLDAGNIITGLRW
jgi:4'-phosphopantetheinyl transferase EntD